MIRLNIDRAQHSSKPQGITIGGIRNRLANGGCEIDQQELAAIIEQGCSFTPALMTGTSGDSWQEQQLIVADIDNDETARDEAGNLIKDSSGHTVKRPIQNPLTSDRAAALCAAAGITPFLMYHTFSNTAELEKYRVIVLLDTPIKDRAEADDITARFANLFNSIAPGSADTTMADAARLLFGSTAGSVFHNSGKATPLHALRMLPKPQAAKPAEHHEPPAPAAAYTAPQKTPGTFDDLKRQRRRDIEDFNLYEYVMQTEHPQEHRSGKTVYFNPCPICGHNDDFTITGHLWHCFSSTSGDVGGTIIDYLMYRHNLTQQEALKQFDSMMNYTPQEAQIAAHRDENGTENKHIDEQEKEAQNGQKTGLLTIERAQQILQENDDEYLTLPRFEKLSDMMKLKRHDTVVIAADTGAGKSSLALNFLYDLQDRYPALYINLEMDEATILQRLISIHTGMELDRIEGYKKDPQTRAAVDAALNEIISCREIQLLTDTYDIVTIEDQIQKATQGRTEPTVVFIDTALLVTTGGKALSRYERFTQISEALRRISRLNNIIMFVLLQQNREGKNDEKKRPTNSSLKESGSWENDATKISFLWYNPKTNRKEIVVTKNRSGKTGIVELNYTPNTQTYREAKNGFIEDTSAPPFDDDTQMIII